MVNPPDISASPLLPLDNSPSDLNVKNTRIGVLIPTLNEEKNIGQIISDLKNSGYHNFMIIDGNSTDRTVKVASQLGAKVITQVGKGKGLAIRQAFSNRYLDTDAFVIMDADGSMSPKEVPIYVEALANGADVVKGSRFLYGGGTFDMSVTRRLGNAFFVSLVNLLWSAKYSDLCYGYMVFSKRAVERLSTVLESKGFDIETEIFLKSLDLGLVVKEVPSVEYERRNGVSNLHWLRDGFKILRIIIRCYLWRFTKRFTINGI